MSTEKKTLTITMTDRRPVEIIEEDWPLLARATVNTEGLDRRDQRFYSVKVLQHKDGRRLVCGERSGGAIFPKRAGVLVEMVRPQMPNESQTILAIRRVCEIVTLPEPTLALAMELGDKCIQQLPPEKLYKEEPQGGQSKLLS